MKTSVQTLTLLCLCGVLSAGAAQHSPSGNSAPQPLSTANGSARLSQTQPMLVHAGFRHFPAHRHVIFVNGGFWWWGYPYPYYGYPAYYYGDAYEKVGKQWGKELRKGKVTVDQFVTYLRLDLVKASDAARSNFQVGFLKGYGKNGLTLFTRALDQAKQGQPSPAPAVQPFAPTQPPMQEPAPKPSLTAPKYQQ